MTQFPSGKHTCTKCHTITCESRTSEYIVASKDIPIGFQFSTHLEVRGNSIVEIIVFFYLNIISLKNVILQGITGMKIRYMLNCEKYVQDSKHCFFKMASHKFGLAKGS